MAYMTYKEKKKFLKDHGFRSRFYRTNVRNFQRSYNLGPALKVDAVFGAITVHAANKVIAAGGNLSENFHYSEFMCACKGTYWGCKGTIATRHLLKGLEKYREECSPNGLHIVSGYRCKRRNRQVGGITGSNHTKGRAADVPQTVKPADYPKSKIPFISEIGYKASSGKICHLGVDDKPKRFFRESY